MVTLAKGIGCIAAANVVVQGLERHGHQHGASVAVDDGLGQARGAAGVDNPQRMVKCQPERHKGLRLCIISACSARQKCVRRSCLHSICRHSRHLVDDQVAHAGKFPQQFRHYGAPVQVTPAIAHAGAGDQHLGRDLAKAVQHRLRAHVRRTNAPDPTDAHRGQKGNHGLGNIGQIRRHPVPRLHPLRLQMQCQ